MSSVCLHLQFTFQGIFCGNTEKSAVHAACCFAEEVRKMTDYKAMESWHTLSPDLLVKIVKDFHTYV